MELENDYSLPLKEGIVSIFTPGCKALLMTFLGSAVDSTQATSCFCKLFKTNFLFCYDMSLINSVVLIPGKQGRDSATHIHVSILPQTPLPSRLPHNTEQSSLCYA